MARQTPGARRVSGSLLPGGNPALFFRIVNETMTVDAQRTGPKIGGMSGLVRRYVWFLVIVVIPVVLSAIYFFLMASDVYVSESRFVVTSPSPRNAAVTSIASLVQTTSVSSGQEQAREILDYLRSRSALADLQRRVDVRARFANHAGDLLTRYPQPFHSDNFESLFRYYESMVGAHVDGESNLAVLTVRGFTPADAHDINADLLQLSEEFVNRLNARSEKQQISEAEARVLAAEARVRAARVALAGYRNAHGLLDPNKQATGVLDVSNKLVAQLTAAQAQLDLTMREAPKNPGIPAMQSNIAALQAQIAMQNGRAVGTSNGIASQLGGYENLAAEEEISNQGLVAAESALAQARVDAARQHFYLERVVQPNTPDEAQLPYRIRAVLTVLGASLLLYFVGWMLIAGILEHAPER